MWPKILQENVKLNVQFAKCIANVLSVYCKIYSVIFLHFFSDSKNLCLGWIVAVKPVRLRHMPSGVSSYFNNFPRYLDIFSWDFILSQQFLVEHDNFDPISGSYIPDFITLSYWVPGFMRVLFGILCCVSMWMYSKWGIYWLLYMFTCFYAFIC